jgi:hypothetical protein
VRMPLATASRWIGRLLDVAVVSGLVALALMVWSIHGTTPLLLIVFMTVGQGLSILSFAAFLAVVVFDLIRSRVVGKGAAPLNLGEATEAEDRGSDAR